MFTRFKSYVASFGVPDIGMVSLTEYFDDTVRHIVRTNNYNKIVNRQNVAEELTQPQGVMNLLLQGGQEVVRRARINHDEIPLRALPSPNAVMRLRDVAEAMSFEQGVLTVCDASRRQYGLETAQVYFTPDEIKKKVPEFTV